MRDRLIELLHYEPLTGAFTWRAGCRAGKAAGTVDAGRAKVCIDYVVYKAHRLAWLYFYGEWPKGDIDHVDGNPLNNAISNLRDVSRSVNMENQRRARADNKLGVLGVSRRGRRFRAEIKADGVRQSLGTFATAEAAHAAYLAAKRQLHVGCTI